MKYRYFRMDFKKKYEIIKAMRKTFKAYKQNMQNYKKN